LIAARARVRTAVTLASRAGRRYAAIAADLNNLSLLSAPLEPIGVLLISVLAILLRHQRRVSAQLVHDAQDLLEQAQSARNTLHTLVETLAAGVVVAAPAA
jgi:hypothetical protein